MVSLLKSEKNNDVVYYPKIDVTIAIQPKVVVTI